MIASDPARLSGARGPSICSYTGAPTTSHILKSSHDRVSSCTTPYHATLLPCAFRLAELGAIESPTGRLLLVGVVGLQLKRSEFYEKELTFQVSCSYAPSRYEDAYEKQGLGYGDGNAARLITDILRGYLCSWLRNLEQISTSFFVSLHRYHDGYTSR